MKGEQFDMNNMTTVGDLKAFFMSVPKEWDGMEVTFRLDYTFEPAIKSMATGHLSEHWRGSYLGMWGALWAARQLAKHMQEQDQPVHAYIQMATVRLGPNGKTHEMQLSNITEPLCLANVRKPARNEDLFSFDFTQKSAQRSARRSVNHLPKDPNGNGIVKRD